MSVSGKIFFSGAWLMLMCTPLLYVANAFAADAQQVQLDAEQQQRLKISTATLQRSEQVPHVQGYAQVLDATQFVMLVGDWLSAKAAYEASANEAKRLTLLHQEEDNASLKSVQAAQAQAVADDSKQRVFGARIALEWSPGVLDDARAIAAKVADGRHALVRIEFPTHLDLKHSGDLELTLPGDETRHWQASILGEASGAQIVTSGSAVLALIDAAAALHVGQRLLAQADPAAARAGLLVPAAAIVTIAGRQWCYEKHDDQHFVRLVLPEDALSLPEGYLVAAAFSSKPVVINGASLLLSVERAQSSAAKN